MSREERIAFQKAKGLARKAEIDKAREEERLRAEAAAASVSPSESS